MPVDYFGTAELFPKRISTIYPPEPIGADIAFRCEAFEGGNYYCKADKDGRPIRAAEAISTSLARHLGLLTADWTIIQNEGGQTFFGSLGDPSTAAYFECVDYLTKGHKDELGGYSVFPGDYLSAIYALDLFLDNPDRTLRNFLLLKEGNRLCPFDFASADLRSLFGLSFPVASSNTVSVGRRLRTANGFSKAAAVEMADRIEAVPAGTIEGFLRILPEDWMAIEQREVLCEQWSGQNFKLRLASLREGLKDDSRL